METKHTPGQWEIIGTKPSGFPLHVIARGPHLDTHIATMETTCQDLHANAALIASAPDLLAALQLIANDDTHIISQVRAQLKARAIDLSFTAVAEILRASGVCDENNRVRHAADAKAELAKATQS